MDKYLGEIQKLVEKTATVTVDGRTYSLNKLHPVQYKPMPAALSIGSLDSFCDYVKEKIDGNEASDLIVFVKNHELVSLVGHLDKETQERKNFINCALPDEREFEFGNFISHEDFIIKLKSLFKETPDSKKLLEFISTITAGETIKATDDGVSQSVVVQSGVSGALKKNATAPSIVELAPFRTFREIEQPKSEFLFRLRQYGGETKAALFEADGAAWKLAAMEQIAAYIKKALPKVTVLS